jgi:hypothetical protein
VGLGTRFKKMATKSIKAITITWTANEPTAGITQTIADGDVPTVAELGQYVANINAQLDNAVADIEELRAAINASEGD